MSDFKYGDEIKAEIATKFNLSEDTVQKAYEDYQAISAEMKNQYLAHFIRTVEVFARKKLDKNNLIITCQPLVSQEVKYKTLSQYYDEQSEFIIFYHPKLDERLIRVLIAHEAGHFILKSIKNDAHIKKSFDESKETEPLCSIFGIFAILEKNDYYADKKFAALQHPGWRDVIKDFSQLANSQKGITNLS